ncbi:MAG: tRNA-dihydrouridine synthase family protein [Lachnospiraceae bacterium]|nr:tRNA-dihydrouridine synthase family protein [Lachnospiraceae bacterium]
MKFYLAPLEGITGHVYRNALEKYFPGTDRYFTPFIAPDQNRILRTKERRDVLPENNRVADLVPQILTNNAEHFLQTARALQELGYQEVNLNLGCPSGTVVSRKRGSGLLAYPEELDRLLEQIFDGTDMKISVKTRIGRDDAEDALLLMEIYRRYPLAELIIHPRTQKDFYRGEPNQKLFGELLAALEKCGEEDNPAQNSGSGSIPVCYNGNLLTEKNYLDFRERFPQVGAVMLGRGVIANPGLIRQIRTGQPTDKKTLRSFHDEVLQGYREVFGEDKNALFRMKEMWIYMIHLFSSHEKYAKKIRKAQSLAEYGCAVDALFGEQELLPAGPERWKLPER